MNYGNLQEVISFFNDKDELELGIGSGLLVISNKTQIKPIENISKKISQKRRSTKYWIKLIPITELRHTSLWIIKNKQICIFEYFI